MDMLKLLKERIVIGLKRKSIKSTSAWAKAYRIMPPPFPGPMNFKYHPWTKEMNDCENPFIVGMKSAQMGYTEVALNKVFKYIDIDALSILYVLPAKNPDASDFSTSRFDPALELSPHLRGLFSSVKNIGHKRAGAANLYIRGSRSRNQLKSIPVAFIVFDEVEEMVQENIPLAMERLSGHIDPMVFLLSTPTLAQIGIHKYFLQTNQSGFFFRCPFCNKYIDLTFPESIIIDFENLNATHLICKKCKNKLDHERKVIFLSTEGNKGALWVPKYNDKEKQGYYINQLYSMTVKPKAIGEMFLSAQTNPTDEQEFYNSKLGLTHEVKGARITNADFNIGQHKKGPSPGLITIGIDVGTFLHYEIDKWIIDKKANNPTGDINLAADCILLDEGKVEFFEELDNLIRDFGVNFGVCDADPERRKALELAQRHWGRMKLCFYRDGLSRTQINVHPEAEHTITVDRTSWLDMSLGRFKKKTIILPINLSIEYKTHLKSLVRVYGKDRYGNPKGEYKKGPDHDHFAHARNYNEIALKLAVSFGKSKNIRKIL